MTWNQFLAVALGLLATALVRLLDRYLPAPTSHAKEAAVPIAGTAAPRVVDLEMIPDEEGDGRPPPEP